MSKCVSVCQLSDKEWHGFSFAPTEGTEGGRERSSSDNQAIRAAACLSEASEDKPETISSQPNKRTAVVTEAATRDGYSVGPSKTNVQKYEDGHLTNDRYLKPLEDQITGEDDKMWNIVASKKKSKSCFQTSRPKPFA